MALMQFSRADRARIAAQTIGMPAGLSTPRSCVRSAASNEPVEMGVMVAMVPRVSPALHMVAISERAFLARGANHRNYRNHRNLRIAITCFSASKGERLQHRAAPNDGGPRR